MLGYYDYTVVLTYLSLIFAVIGSSLSICGGGHPYLGLLMLALSGLCDAFDGRIARAKKNRTVNEKNFGMQIDSLADLVAFGVLPCFIGMGIYKSNFLLRIVERTKACTEERVIYGVCIAIFIIYTLAALIRLAYYNVLEMEAHEKGKGGNTHFTGLPVTSAAFILPTYMAIQYFLSPCIDISMGYFIILILLAGLFTSKMKVKKPSMRTVLLLIGFVAFEFAMIIIVRRFYHVPL